MWDEKYLGEICTHKYVLKYARISCSKILHFPLLIEKEKFRLNNLSTKKFLLYYSQFEFKHFVKVVFF